MNKVQQLIVDLFLAQAAMEKNSVEINAIEQKIKRLQEKQQRLTAANAEHRTSHRAWCFELMNKLSYGKFCKLMGI